MVLLLDIGNTHTHVGLGGRSRVSSVVEFPTRDLAAGHGLAAVASLVRGRRIDGAVLCSVVPRATAAAQRLARSIAGRPAIQLGPATLRGIGIRYPKPGTIGQDRLANAIAVHAHFGAPSIVIDFGTAATFDVVDAHGNFVGGIIAPGIAALTGYLHEKTALLPSVELREPRTAIGRNTAEAIQIGAVLGYRGLVRGLIGGLHAELRAPGIPVVATGAYARLVARGVPEITAIRPGFTLEGLRLLWFAHHRTAA
jgi:type III pantothenate kinase